jgi:protein arginine N-methyltransferase 1
MANQADAAKTDPLTGMPHSEAHYFNRYPRPCAVEVQTC